MATGNTDTDLSELPHWSEQPELWDSCFIAGDLVPGVVTVKIKRGKKVDVKSAKGKNKATVTLQGFEPAKIDITIRIYSADELIALNDLMPSLEPVADKAKATDLDALDVASPAFAMRGIRSIIITELDGPELVAGILTMTLTAIEYDAPPKPKGLGTGTGGGAGSSAVYIGTFQTLVPGGEGQTFFAQALLLSGSTKSGMWVNEQGTKFGPAAFVLEDPIATKDYQDEQNKHTEYSDVTSTPKGSKGGDYTDPGKKFGTQDNGPADPADGSGGP